MTNGFWRGRRILLTGHTGFKGAWLALWLQRLGAQVTGYSQPPPTQPNLFELAHVAVGMDSQSGDVRDLGALVAAMTRARPEIVIHMAAQTLVRYGYANPVETYATNVMGTVHVLEAIRRQTGVRVALMITSDKCYENREWVWGYREEEPFGGRDPYSNSKGCAELVTAAYRQSYFAPGADVALGSARAGNVIGGGDWAVDRLVPDTMTAFGAGRTVIIRNPQAIRPWQHVLEPLSGYLLLAERLWEKGAEYAEGWNFGPRDEDARPVAWVVERLATLWGEGANWECDFQAHPHEARFLKLDCSKARHRLGWSPRLPLEQGLAWTADWYRAHQLGHDLREVTLEQIERYEALESS
jgi:CDP-glucose 4,6-dehydratase